MPDKSIEIINYNGTEYEVGIQSLATSEKKGLMSPEDKDKLENMLVSSVSGNDPISVSNTSGTATISHNDSGVTANTYGVTATTGLTPGFGSTFSVPGFTVNAKGHVTAAGAHNVTIPATLANTTNPGLMSAGDKSRLDNMADNAKNTTIKATSPIVASATTGEVTLTHATSGPSTSGDTSRGDTSNQTPGFGGTFNVTSATVDKYGHTKTFASHTVTIPSTLASSNTNGLMSKTDKANFDAGIGIAGNTIAIGGSLDASTLRTSLGLSNAMHFIGIATVAITDGSTTNPSISGYTFGTNGVSAQKGDVVIDKDSAYEFVWTGSKWERLGPDGSYALVDHTHNNATAQNSGFMSATDKVKMDGLTVYSISGTTPISATNTSGAVSITHATSGPSTTADTSKGDTTNQTPGWGETFKVTSGTVDKYGHTKTFAEHTVTIPSAVATTGAAGLMSAADKVKLDSAAAENHNHDSVYVKKVGDTMSGYLTVGTTSQSAAPTAAITIHDTRNYAWTPTSISKGVNWYFTMNNSPNTSKWWSVMHLTGWTGDYNAWELAGPSHNEDQRTVPLYVRTGRTTNGWGSWRKIYDTSNKPVLTTTTVGSASAGTAISADDITAWTTNTPTAVTKKTVVTSATFNSVVTGGSTTDIPNISKKTVVTSATAATASYDSGILTISNGSVTTGDSVTVGTAIKAYTSLTTGASGSATTGDSVTVTAGTAASLTYTSRSIPNISVTSTTVATGAVS